MTRPLNLDFTISVPKNFNFSPPVVSPQPLTVSSPSFIFSESVSCVPAVLPGNIYAEEGKVLEGDWINYLKRCFIPSYASTQDKKVSDFFICYFKKILESESVIDREKVGGVLSLADQWVSRKHGWIFSPSAPNGSSRLLHYIFAARNRLNIFDSIESKQELFSKCYYANKALFERWSKLGFSEEAFWSTPDLVDFIFKAYLHRYITHPYYKHTISMQNCLLRREGQITVDKEPHLLFSGRQTPWAEIRKTIQVDHSGRLYSENDGKKKQWTYLDRGFTPMNDDNFMHPLRLRKLDRPPASNQVQIVTTHAHQEDRVLIDRVLKGTRHSMFRIIPGEGFSTRHPEMNLASGEVYSFGWGTRWADFSLSSPLSTLKGQWSSPDEFEFFKQDQCVTPIDISDEKLIKLIEIIRRRNQEERPFHFVTANCCGITAEVLSEAGVIDLCTKNHMSYLEYKFFVPKAIRYYIDQFLSVVNCITPNFVVTALSYMVSFLHSVIYAPLFSLLGAWRTNIVYEDEDDPAIQNQDLVRASNRAKALFCNVIDLFRPSKMELDLTKNIYKWQKKQVETFFEKRD